MYSNLEAEMTRKKITRHDLAELLHLNYSTICVRMNGKPGFDIVEAFIVRDHVAPDMTIDELFAIDQNKAS